MKPKEFDELVRQKFDQNDFAYKPANWDLMAEKLEGRAKKRSILVWWWIPLAGMAASVALAMGSTSLLQHSMPASSGVKTEMAQTRKAAHPGVVNTRMTTLTTSLHSEVAYASTAGKKNAKATNQHDKNINDWFHIRLNEVSLKSTNEQEKGFNFLAVNDNNKVKPRSKKEEVIVKEGYNTFKEEEQEVAKKPSVISITLLGGYNQNGQNTGYMAGAAVRRMLSDKLYIESDVAFTSSSNSQTTQYATYAYGGKAPAAKNGDAKSSNTDVSKTTSTPVLKETITTEAQNYNLYYAQVSPSIGYKVIKRIAIGVGPDFQQMLQDKRPVASNVDRGNIQVAPLFDVGLIGKSEFLLTKRIQAAVSYRKGINNVLTPMDKYIDRDYLQFQLKCTIFNK